MADLVVPRKAKFYEFDPLATPALSCNPGDRLLFATTEAPDGQIRTERDRPEAMDPGRANPTTGPVAVAGCFPGDVLAVTVERISVDDGPGYMVCEPSYGVLSDLVPATATRILTIADGRLEMGRFTMTLNPMIGVLGTTPAQPVKTTSFGPHGGNMDNRKITAGARVFLPVFVPGALFGLGDLHASMGDGEICGCGVEAAGEALVRVDICRGFSLDHPVIETELEMMVSGEGADVTGAIRSACVRMHSLLTRFGGLTPEDAYLFLSAFGHVEICQIAFCYGVGSESDAPRASVRMTIPRILELPRCAAPD